ncbi:hypothetical protein DQE82_22460 [Micromonospora sp. LHW51205]|uniref:hypothetical protein n=1 Tax=Micromonospora sp. LHW51205 TaxID=2248752 RepID=UPI000DE97D77|nr:hypothetical protein [Micromonospora sp. LHW51205]NHO81051.1 hypothetical protein [Micromonospora sp. CMU55-4]RBQ06435.1 hypothetical protein DQE82_22460 [Micromonospora sp. LHW51205]
MTVRVVADRRRGGVLHVVGSSEAPRRAERPGWFRPTRLWRGPSGPPRRAEDRRWETDARG